MNNNINQDYFGSGEGGSGNTSGNTVSNTVSGTTPAQLEVITAKNYSQADVGDNPAVNLAVGRLKYIFSDLSVGHGNFNIAISHVYNSMLNENFRGTIVGLGNNWKLNLSQSIIQDYVNQDGAKIFKYMDELGEVHRFVPFASNRYYDERNAKVTLTDNMFGCVISDGVGNELHFDSDGLLSKSVSCQDSSIEKIYTYDEQKRLISVYDSRTIKNKVPKSSIKFTYYGDYLTSVTSYGDFNRKLFCLTYEYSDGNLVSVNKVAFNKSGLECLSQQIAEFCYKDNNLYRIIDSQTKQAYQFEYYADGKLAKMSSGVIVDKTLSLGMTDSQGTPLQLGQVQCEGTFSRKFVTKSVNSYKYTMYSDTDPVAVQTDVTNNNNITLTYFIDRNACITSCFEKVGTDLKTLNKQGAKRISGNIENSTQTINGHYGIVPAGYGNPSWGGDIIFTADGGLARNKAEQNVRNYEYSFWLKIPKAYECMQARIEYTFASWAGKTRIERVYVDGQAVNAWQRVSLPVTVPVDSDGNPDTSRLTFWISLSGNKSTVKDRFEINEIGFTPAPYTEMLLANHNAIDIPFNKCTKATLGVMDGSYNITNREYVLNRDIFFTEADVIATRTNEYAHKYYTIGQELFDVICNNGTKRIPNVSYLLFDNPDGGYSATSDIPFVIRTTTPDGGMTTATEYRFTSSTMTIVTTGQRGDVTSAKAVVTDYRGKTLNETDEYNVSTQYEYDGYGRLTKTTVYASDGTVGAVENYSYNEDGSLYSADNELNGQQFDYDEHEQLNRITMLEYGGEDGSLKATEYSTETKYGVYRDQPLQVQEYIGTDTVARNKVTYEKGRIRTVTDGTAKYGVKYDDVNSTVEYTQFDGDTERTVQRDSVSEYVTNTDGSVTQTHTSTFYDEDGNTESTSTELDTYGQVLNVKRNDETFTYGYTDSSESRFAAKPNRLTNGMNVTDYSYDDDGNLTGWTDKENGTKVFAVQQIAEDTTRYNFLGIDYYSSLQRDSNKTLSPRVAAAKNMWYLDSQTGFQMEEIPEFCQEYTYDKLGRADTTETKYNYQYKYGYLTVGSNRLLKTHNYKNYAYLYPYNDVYNSADIQQNDELEYYGDGKIKSIKQPFRWKIHDTPYSKTYESNGTITRKYLYDNVGRISKETLLTQRNGGTIVESSKAYTYRTDGRIDSVVTDIYYTTDGVRKQIVKGEQEQRNYDAYGRLSGIGATTYRYDAYGNRINESRMGEGASYEYVNGSMLSKVRKDGTTATYEYNSDVARTAKTVNGVTTKYFLEGNKIIGEQTGSEYLKYFYGRDGLVGFHDKTKKYNYVYDSQGNITMVFGNNFQIEFAQYVYDSYGNCTVYDGDGRVNTDPNFIGNVNPFRWKGFYYDVETGLYYANGSYYDPKTGLYVDASPIDTVIDNALNTRSIDRNGLLCNNILELAGNPYTIYNSVELSPDPTYNLEDSFPDWLKRKIARQKKLAAFYNSIPWYLKLGIGIFLLRLAVAFTVLTDGTGAAAVSVLIQVAIGVGVGIGMYALSSLIAGTFSWQGLANAALDAFLVSSAIAFVSSSVNAIKYACRSKPSINIEQELKARAEAYRQSLNTDATIDNAKLKFATVTYDSKLGAYTYAYNSEIVGMTDDMLNATLRGMSARTSCAEIQAVNKALNAGSKLSNLYIYTVNVQTGGAAYACRVCSRILNGKVAAIFTGVFPGF